MRLWAKRAAGRQVLIEDQTGDGTAAPAEHAADGGPHRRPGPDATGQVQIDLRDAAGWAARVEPDPVRAAELAQRFRARAARAEAQRELMRLRSRHWSGERVVEEARTTIEWWEHSDADPYAVLGLLPGARIEEAAAARRRVAHDCHPDRIAARGGNDEMALRRMVAANAAYDRLRRALHPV